MAACHCNKSQNCGVSGIVSRRTAALPFFSLPSFGCIATANFPNTSIFSFSHSSAPQAAANDKHGLSGISPRRFVVPLLLVLCAAVGTSSNFAASTAGEISTSLPNVIGASATLEGAEEETDEEISSDSSDKSTKLGGKKLAELMQLELGEIEQRMQALFDMIDENKDSEINAEEAKDWSMKLKTAMHQHQVEMEFQAIDKNNDGKVTLSELESTYITGTDPKQLEEQKQEVQKRFKAVDKNGDDVLVYEELVLLMDPGKDEELTELEVQEILNTQDKNKDGKITLEEFIETEGGAVGDSEKEELEKEFKTYDTDNDGSINAEELRKIIREPHSYEIDSLLEDFTKEMEDGKISRDLWTRNFEKFAVSMLTDNGEVLRYPEDYKGIQFPYASSASSGDKEEAEEETKHEEL